MKKAQRSQRKWLKLSLKIDFFGMKNYKKSWVDPPVSHYILFKLVLFYSLLMKLLKTIVIRNDERKKIECFHAN